MLCKNDCAEAVAHLSHFNVRLCNNSDVGTLRGGIINILVVLIDSFLLELHAWIPPPNTHKKHIDNMHTLCIRFDLNYKLLWNCTVNLCIEQIFSFM